MNRRIDSWTAINVADDMPPSWSGVVRMLVYIFSVLILRAGGMLSVLMDKVGGELVNEVELLPGRGLPKIDGSLETAREVALELFRAFSCWCLS